MDNKMEKMIDIKTAPKVINAEFADNPENGYRVELKNIPINAIAKHAKENDKRVKMCLFDVERTTQNDIPLKGIFGAYVPVFELECMAECNPCTLLSVVVYDNIIFI